jgi:hypothetical protein
VGHQLGRVVRQRQRLVAGLTAVNQHATPIRVGRLQTRRQNGRGIVFIGDDRNVRWLAVKLAGQGSLGCHRGQHRRERRFAIAFRPVDQAQRA